MNKFRAAFKDRYSTALVADAAYRAGVHVGVVGTGLHPLDTTWKISGPARTVDANNDLAGILLALNRAREGDVLVILNRRGEAGVTGDIIATEASRGGLQGIVVDGLVRDTVDIVGIGLPVFSRGRVPIGPLKLPQEQKGIAMLGVRLPLGHATVEPGQWIVADSDGVLVLNAEDLPVVMDHAERALESESKLVEKIRSGTPLGDIFAIEDFARKREADPDADFNDHLASLKRAI